ncbi:hypothetical protein [Arthrobacter sp. Br18]|uniref:hypothetical protein n=1 Tax=Arthrobacter sp. Br18 TaxID=1312954 RepID=UPI00047E3095|nr:hypothetical protein [Arthrobacter sp. Br18]
MQWVRKNKASIPAYVTLLAVAGFWIAGGLGALDVLGEASSPMAMLAGLYLMLALVAVSIIVTVLALTDLTRRAADTKRQRRMVQ